MTKKQQVLCDYSSLYFFECISMIRILYDITKWLNRHNTSGQKFDILLLEILTNPRSLSIASPTILTPFKHLFFGFWLMRWKHIWNSASTCNAIFVVVPHWLPNSAGVTFNYHSKTFYWSDDDIKNFYEISLLSKRTKINTICDVRRNTTRNFINTMNFEIDSKRQKCDVKIKYTKVKKWLEPVNATQTWFSFGISPFIKFPNLI